MADRLKGDLKGRFIGEEDWQGGLAGRIDGLGGLKWERRCDSLGGSELAGIFDGEEVWRGGKLKRRFEGEIYYRGGFLSRILLGSLPCCG